MSDGIFRKIPLTEDAKKRLEQGVMYFTGEYMLPESEEEQAKRLERYLPGNREDSTHDELIFKSRTPDEIKTRLNDGLDEFAVTNDIPATDVLAFTEHFAAGLVEEIGTSPISVELPITTYVNGERQIIGRGKIAGGMFSGIIDNPPADEITEKIKRDMFSAVAMNFSVTPAITAPVDSDGNIVFRKTY